MENGTGQTLTTRPATTEDIPFVAWCNYEATSPEPGFCYWDPLVGPLGTDSMTFITTVFEERALAWGDPEDFVLVEADGQPIAGASGFVMDAYDYRPLRMDRLPAVAKRLSWDDEMLAQFMSGYKMVWSDPLDETLKPTAPWVIECVAVKPDVRGRGVGQVLLEALFEVGKQRGFTQCAISVTIGNASAERLYDRVGFEKVMTYWPAHYYGQFPGTHKYRIDLIHEG